MDLFKLVGTIAINTQDADRAIDSTTEKAKGLGSFFTGSGNNSTSSKASKFFGKVGAASVWAGNMLTRVTDKTVQLTKSFFKSGFDFNSTMERYTKSFVPFFDNDIELAEEFMGKLHEIAKITPLNLTNLAEGSKLLLGAGLNADETLETLKMWGDISLGDPEMFSRLVRAHSQAIGNQTFLTEEMNQMTDAGFPIKRYLSEHLGMDGQDLRELIRDGGISSDVILEILRDLTSPGGPFHGQMEQAMTGYAGQLEKLGDTYAQASGAFTEPFFDIASSDVLPRVNGLLGEFFTWCENNKESIQEFATSVGDFVVNALSFVKDIITILIDNKDSLPGVAVGISLIVAAISPTKGLLMAIATAGTLIIANWETIRDTAVRIWGDIENAVDSAVIAVERFFGINKGSGIHESEGGIKHGGTGGTFATGLDRVPYNEFPALLHRNEAVLTASEADAWRSGTLGIELSTLITETRQLKGLMQQLVNNSSAGNNVVLDSGALVGNLLPKIDSGLNDIMRRKMRL